MRDLRIKRLIGKVFKGMGALLLMALTGCILYFIVITTDTPERQNTLQSARASQPSVLAEGTGLALSSLAQAKETFGGKLLVLADNSGFQLESIEMRNWRPNGAPEPVCELRLGYTGDAGALWVSSVSPASYLNSLPERGYTPLSDQGVTLAGLQAVLLVAPDNALRVCAQLENVVFEIEGSLTKEALCQLAWQAKLIGG